MHPRMDALKAEVVDGETQQAAEVNPQDEKMSNWQRSLAPRTIRTPGQSMGFVL